MGAVVASAVGEAGKTVGLAWGALSAVGGVVAAGPTSGAGVAAGNVGVGTAAGSRPDSSGRTAKMPRKISAARKKKPARIQLSKLVRRASTCPTL